jgi:PKD repeat protein
MAGGTGLRNYHTTLDAMYYSYRGGSSDVFYTILPTEEEYPIALAGPDFEIDQHEAITFNGSQSSDKFGIINWTWVVHYGDVSYTYNTPIVPFTFDVVGLYDATLTVYDERGFSDSDVVNVTVRDITAPIAVTGKNWTIAEHESVLLNANGSSDNVGIVNYTWTYLYNGTEIALYGPVQNITFDIVGLYEIVLNVTDLAGNGDETRITVEVLDMTFPLAVAGENRTIDQHEVVVFNGTGSWDNVGIVNWTWTFGYNGSHVILQGPTAPFIFDVAGNYNITLEVSDASGKNATDNTFVFVNDITPPHADAGPDVEILQYQTVVFNSSGSYDNVGITNWTWKFHYQDDLVEINESTPSFIFDYIGVYFINLFVTDLVGLQAHDSFTVTVRDVTKPVADAGDNLSMDQFSTVDFDGSRSTDNVLVVNWTWRFFYLDQLVELHGERPFFKFDVPGIYEVTLVVRDGWNLSDIDNVNVIVRDVINPVAIIMMNDSAKVHESLALDGRESYDNVGVTEWNWSIAIGNNTYSFNEPMVTFIFPIPGDFDVTLTVSDATGLTHSEVKTIQITKDPVEPPIAPEEEDGSGIWLILMGIIVAIATGLLLYVLWKRQKDKD